MQTIEVQEKLTALDQLDNVRPGNMVDMCGVLNTNVHDLDDSHGFVLQDASLHEVEVFVAKGFTIPQMYVGDAVLLYNVMIAQGCAHFTRFTKAVALSPHSQVHSNDQARVSEIELLETLMTKRKMPSTPDHDATIEDILQLLNVDSKTMTVPCSWLTFDAARYKQLPYISIVHLTNGIFEVGKQFRIYGQIVEIDPPRFYISHSDGAKHAKCRLQLNDECGGAAVLVEFSDGHETLLTGVDIANSTNRRKRLTKALERLRGQWIQVAIELRRNKILGFGVVQQPLKVKFNSRIQHLG